MKPYQQEMDKCPICGNEDEVFVETNRLVCFENKVSIFFGCENCNSRWKIIFMAQYVLIGEFEKEFAASGGIELIAAERQRQINVEGFTAEHDKQRTKEELVKAAVCYALPAKLRKYGGALHSLWPFERKWWKPSPKDRIKELAKAGALIAAEIDRLLAKGVASKR